MERSDVSDDPRHESDRVNEAFARVVSLVRTATGRADRAIVLRTHLIPLCWLCGGYGALDWSHHQVIDGVTADDAFTEASSILKREIANMRVIPPGGAMVRGSMCRPDDGPKLMRLAMDTLRRYRAEVKRVGTVDGGEGMRF